MAALPLRGIAIFEAASRCKSFKAAASELNLTPSAVSHQIRQLEEVLGVKLFSRTGRAVMLTAEGTRYSRTVRQAFASLRQATSEISLMRPIEQDIVKIRVPPSFASRWLLPRLSAFLEHNTDIDIRVSATAQQDARNDGFDLLIVHGDTDLTQKSAVLLMQERMQPLCSPEFLESNPISSPQDIITGQLISTRVNSLSWEEWFFQQGIRLSGVRFRAIQLDPSLIAIDAAVRGLGIVLESDILTKVELTSGRLVCPLPETSVLLSSYWLVTPEKALSPATREFKDWLLRQSAHEN